VPSPPRVTAHRLSTILTANVILVVDRGRLVARGTHAGLPDRGGMYAALHEQQFLAHGQVPTRETTLA
jgi:ABC-type multidrug transport system fused ATPase/permease subunit